jgi:hypothetical protein
MSSSYRPPSATSNSDRAGDNVDTVTTDVTGARVRRLARPHSSGGMVIERAVILAEGTDSAAILDWISDHGGVADSTVTPSRSSGLHGSRATVAADNGPARRFVLPAHVFA